MFIQTVEIKREKNSNWEKGFLVGVDESSDNSTFLDINYQALPQNTDGLQIYDYRNDLDRNIKLNIPIAAEY